MTKKYKYYIGIDAGTQTGICVYSSFEKKIRHISTVKIHVAMKAVQYWHDTNPGEVMVRVEDARKATYNREKDYHKAQGAGSIKRDAKIWEDYLKDIGVDFEMVRPNNATTKMDLVPWQRITGFTGTTSSHARDAAMIVFGK